MKLKENIILSLKLHFYKFCCVFIFLGYHGDHVIMNTYRFYLRIKLSCIHMHLDMIAVNLFRLIQFYDTDLNLLSYIELVGGVFAPLYYGFLLKFVVEWSKM